MVNAVMFWFRITEEESGGNAEDVEVLFESDEEE